MVVITGYNKEARLNVIIAIAREKQYCNDYIGVANFQLVVIIIHTLPEDKLLCCDVKGECKVILSDSICATPDEEICLHKTRCRQGSKSTVKKYVCCNVRTYT